MNKLLSVIAVVVVAGALLADSPPPTEEQIEAKLNEARKKVEAAVAEERALAKRLEEARREPRGHIHAEVAGVLCWGQAAPDRTDAPAGYYVRVRTGRGPKQEMRVSLVVPENKFLVGQLDEAKGRDIVVTGRLSQDEKGALTLDGVEVKPQKPPK